MHFRVKKSEICNSSVVLAIFKIFCKTSHFALPGKVSTVECACRPTPSASLNGVATKHYIFLLRGALARREKYFVKNIFGALSNFILKIQEIRSWLKTLFNQCYFGCFWSPDLHKSDFFIKSALFAKKCTFTENMTFLLKISILH